ncbi:zf-AN1 type zinc finger protein [Schizosaccharomyces japonicus yFS275]|uniref:Zf-AN1 type zinc finger protein n=1 Tax=Schizosaccharomyces japonicus (strain yFS275 / FY16936) TaxID=402676 RepID=B6K604_SCHJY|nr:zf-AN1 type zinc finger protein [Schizosaccharomyces japonicus yFS275]EEB08958.1 zf-AN1 type zinc finger protein [Schizosaccharomyces japonicus yFS275]
MKLVICSQSTASIVEADAHDRIATIVDRFLSSVKPRAGSENALAAPQNETTKTLRFNDIVLDPSRSLQDYDGLRDGAVLQLELSTATATAAASAPSIVTNDSSASLSSMSTFASSSSAAPASRPKAGGKKRCSLATCNRLAQRMVGDCMYCKGHFCSAHRLLEDHRCASLAELRASEHERNRQKLEKEHCDALVSKV